MVDALIQPAAICRERPAGSVRTLHRGPRYISLRQRWLVQYWPRGAVPSRVSRPAPCPCPCPLGAAGRPRRVPGRGLVVRCERRAEDGVHRSRSTRPTRRRRFQRHLPPGRVPVRRTGGARPARLAGLGLPARRDLRRADHLRPLRRRHRVLHRPPRRPRIPDGRGNGSSASCSASCNGVFSQLKEVYLFGCNTLKSEPRHSRLGRDRAQPRCARATRRPTPSGIGRLLSERYGREQPRPLRHIFKDVPVLYGFSSKAPLGRTARAAARALFPDRRRRARSASGRPSPTLLKLFGPSSMIAVAGLTDARPARGLPPRHVRLRGRSALRRAEGRLHARGAAARRDRSAHVPRSPRALRGLARAGAAPRAEDGRGARCDRERPRARANATSSLRATPTKRRSHPHDGAGAQPRVAVARAGAGGIPAHDRGPHGARPRGQERGRPRLRAQPGERAGPRSAAVWPPARRSPATWRSRPCWPAWEAPRRMRASFVR